MLHPSPLRRRGSRALALARAFRSSPRRGSKKPIRQKIHSSEQSLVARRLSSRDVFLDGGAVRDGGVAEDGDDPGADVHAVLLVLEILHARGVGDGAVLADARVLVDDSI